LLLRTAYPGTFATAAGSLLIAQVFLCGLLFFRRRDSIPVSVQRRRTTYWLINAALLLSLVLQVLCWPAAFAGTAYKILVIGAFFSAFIYVRWRRDGSDAAAGWLIGLFVGTSFFQVGLWIALVLEWYRTGVFSQLIG